MKNATSPPDPPREAETPSPDGSASSRLLDRHSEATSELKKKTGRPPGVKDSKPRAKKGEGDKPSPEEPSAKVVLAQAAREAIYRRTGKAFRSICNILALKTNCTVWLLDPTEEQDLGETFGDLLLDIGLVDSTITKSVFAVGTLLAVGGSKTIGYIGYVNAQKTANPKTSGGAGAAKSSATMGTDPNAVVIPESKPGNI